MRAVRVLLAEDNHADVYLVNVALRQAGLNYALQVLSHGDEAKRHIERLQVADPGSTCPDVFILDLNLPGASGQELLVQFRARCQEVPVVVFTSSDAPSDAESALEAGASRYFRKPSDLPQFLKIGTIVKELLGQAKPDSL